MDNTVALTGLADLFAKCWRTNKVPNEWHQSVVTAIFKKGAPDVCDNYRPISLLCVAYKVYATILLRRLQDAAAEDRLTPSQYGFRRGYGTIDAIFWTRRLVEAAAATKNGKICMLALDWKKAFDSLNPNVLQHALRRSGVPSNMLAAIADIYASRTFTVADGNQQSAEHHQHAGISQGCPLSPFLFVMTMSVVMADAVAMMSPQDQEAHRKGQLFSLLYADDTLLVGEKQRPLQAFLDAVACVGRRFGLELHWGKFQMIQIGTAAKLVDPGGSQINAKEAMTYLGATVASQASVSSEFHRGIGRADAEYSKLTQLWKHTSCAWLGR